ncbi:MAG: hypothetical protein HWN66_17800, partial [Candidatus Helarchaeota archaeon]|nr:hypothetical protein [Candidatus Helarchaeota archaeon]
VLSKFTEIRPKLRSGTKHRNVKKLIAIITYFCLKFRNVPVNQHDLIGASDFTRKEFNDFMLRIQQYLPEYVDRNRQYYIAQRIFEITEHFNLEMPYYFLAKKVMNELWDGIKNTTDNVVTGLVCSISALCSCRDKVSVNSICKRLGIRMSTVQVQVRKKIFDRFRVKGFVSLIKSSDLLIKIMEKLGLSGEHEGEPQEGVATIGRVEIILGSASEVFNSHDNVDYYYFVVKGEGKAPLVMTLKINNLPLNFEIDWRQEDIQVGKLLNFEVYRNFALKDPPLVDA